MDRDSEAAERDAPPSYAVAILDPPPPLYTDETTDESLPPPPTYESLYGRFQAAHRESTDLTDFFKKFISVLTNTIGYTICLTVTLVIPTSMIVVGGYYKNDCKAEPFIPNYLIVAGVFGIVKNLYSLREKYRRRQDERKNYTLKKKIPVVMETALSCFLLLWFILGNVWIYKRYNRWSPDPESKIYCNPVLYYFSFWTMTATYIILLTLGLCVCFGGSMMSIFCKSETLFRERRTESDT